MKLISIPPEIGLLISLTHLNLEFNQISSLPPEIGQLTALVRHSKALIYFKMDSDIQERITMDTNCEEGALKHTVKSTLLDSASVIGYG